MKQLHFDIRIAAAPRQVWQRMLDKPTYEEWTAAFCSGSTYKGDWAEGSEMRFLGPDGGGMQARVLQNRAGERVQLLHLGEIVGGEPRAADGWSNADESYFFSDEAGGTRLRVQMDCAPAYEEMMKRMWPDALQRLKTLCERAPA